MLRKVLCLVWLSASCLVPLAQAEEQIIQQVSASGSRNLRPFTVNDKWEVRWKTTKFPVVITIKKADGEMSGMASSGMNGGSGASFQPKGGTFYLDISSMGDWTVTVVQLP